MAVIHIYDPLQPGVALCGVRLDIEPSGTFVVETKPCIACELADERMNQP